MLLKTRAILIPAAVALMFSCSNQKDSATPKTDDLYQFKKIDLRPFDIPATIYIPDETAGIGASFKTSIEHEEDFKWYISAGPNFELFIEDWGENAKRMEEFHKKLKESKVFASTIIERKDNRLLYKRELIDPVKVEEYKHISYHIYALIPIDGVYYEIRNKPSGDALKTAKLMLTTLKSFKPCPLK